jgi:hypothetical protein
MNITAVQFEDITKAKDYQQLWQIASTFGEKGHNIISGLFLP